MFLELLEGFVISYLTTITTVQPVNHKKRLYNAAEADSGTGALQARKWAD